MAPFDTSKFRRFYHYYFGQFVSVEKKRKKSLVYSHFFSLHNHDYRITTGKKKILLQQTPATPNSRKKSSLPTSEAVTRKSEPEDDKKIRTNVIVKILKINGRIERKFNQSEGLNTDKMVKSQDTSTKTDSHRYKTNSYYTLIHK